MVLPEKIEYILGRLHEAGFEAYVVGGCVRDHLAGRPPHDWDICTAALPEQVHRVFCDHTVRDTGVQHGTVSLILEHLPYEITTFRIDGAYSDSRRPDSVTFTRDIVRDLARRDFTVNAMAYSPRTGLVDPFGGREDLARGILRAVGDPAARFNEDALRILRALRFAARFRLSIEPDTDAALRALAPTLTRIAAERIKTELDGILTGPGAGDILRGYPEVLGVVIPEILPCVGFQQHNIHHVYDVWEHTLRAVEAAPADPLLRWTMLFHDLGKPPCFFLDGQGAGHFYGHGARSAEIAEDIMARLRFSNAERDTIYDLVRRHDRVIEPTERSVRRLLGKIGRTQFDRLIAVHRADTLAQNPVYAPERLPILDRLTALADAVAEAAQCVDLRHMAVNGRDLIALGYAPGPALGAELDRLFALVLDDPVQNEKETLLTIARRDMEQKTAE